jgi:hypothetical protein
MKKDIDEELINDILQSTQKCDKVLLGKINALADLYHDQKTQNEKLYKENLFFIKKWDKRNIVENEKKDMVEFVLPKFSKHYNKLKNYITFV